MGSSDAASVTALFFLATSCACFAKNPAAMPSAGKCKALPNMNHAQTSWRSYRDAHCDMIAALYTNGSGKAVGEAMCIIDLSRLRIRELWEIGGYPCLPEPK